MTATLYKLTDELGRTGIMQGGIPLVWSPGVTHSLPTNRMRTELCSSGVIHAYRDPVLGVLIDPYHGSYTWNMSFQRERPFMLWEVEGEVVADDGTKVGCWEIRAVRRLDPPSPSPAEVRRLLLEITLGEVPALEADHMRGMFEPHVAGGGGPSEGDLLFDGKLGHRMKCVADALRCYFIFAGRVNAATVLHARADYSGCAALDWNERTVRIRKLYFPYEAATLKGGE